MRYFISLSCSVILSCLAVQGQVDQTKRGGDQKDVRHSSPAGRQPQHSTDFGLYQVTLQKRIYKAWIAPKGYEDKSVTVAFTIHPDGKVSDVKIYQSSNIPVADQAALKAVKDCGQFAPLPGHTRLYKVMVLFSKTGFAGSGADVI